MIKIKIHKEYNVGITEQGDIINLKTNKPYSKWIDNVGYYQVMFRVDGKKKYVRIHRLVAEMFIDNPNNLPQVNHIDGNKLNNRVENLEWVTNKYNTQHGYDNNVYKNKYRCELKVTNKITGDVLYFKSIRKCSDTLNINRKTITSILKGIKKTNNYDYEFEYK
nr:MAG TPA: homing endonuclease [Caudoviricetes sp.]